MSKSMIEWTDEVWNPVTGCSKVSPGCANCYAERMSKRLAGRCGYPIDNPFRVTLHPDKIDDPLKWKKPRRIFVNSMSDLFHEDVPFEFIRAVWVVMVTHRHHTYMVLTKRPKRMLEFFNWMAAQEFKIETYRNNIWLGVSIENQVVANERIPLLLQAPVTVRFISAEPLLGPVNIAKYLPHDAPKAYKLLSKFYGPSGFDSTGSQLEISTIRGLDWVIVGGESGSRARLMHPDWVRSLRDQCQTANVPFFFKQWGEFTEVCRYESWSKYRDHVGGVSRAVGLSKLGLLNADGSDLVNGGPEHKVYPISHLERVGKKQAGRILDGRTWDELPEIGGDAE